MSSLSMVEARLPPGFRFHPRDDELVIDYLGRKLDGTAAVYGVPMLVDVDLNKCEPWDLPEVACIGGKEWYFFSLRDRKYATGQRTNRATESGYWKATGKDRLVSRRNLLVGMRKTLVFYQGRAPKGKKTEWVMHEFRNEGQGDTTKQPSFKEDWVLCRVFYKSRNAVPRHPEDVANAEAPAMPLPPLVDTFISFEQGARNAAGYEQVPCFSNPAPMLPGISPMELAAGSSCDDSAIKEMLSQFTRVDGCTSIVKREISHQAPQDGLESYLSENGLPNMWGSF